MFWSQAGERAAKTFAQTMLVILGAGPFNVINVGWMKALGLAGGAAVLSLLSSLASEGVGQPSSPSLVRTAPNAPEGVSGQYAGRIGA